MKDNQYPFKFIDYPSTLLTESITKHSREQLEILCQQVKEIAAKYPVKVIINGKIY